MPVLDDFQLDGKTALVTGCRRGIGKAMAVGLAEAGADIVGVSREMESHASQIEQEVKAVNRNFHGYSCDFSHRDSLYSFINQVKTDFPVIDILVNNVGTTLRKPAAEHSDDYWDQIIEVNQNAQFILTREIGKRMIERGTGKIIFTASLLTFQGGINVPSYAASKGAIGQLTMAFANEWASKGVNVNAIAPGLIWRDGIEEGWPEGVKAWNAAAPLGRLVQPDDIASAVVFLSSDAAASITGIVLTIDCGLSIKPGW